MMNYDLIIIGGSASGLCAAIQAARTGNASSIAVLERMPRAGKKILATGNGRCNLSNIRAAEHPYHNAEFAKHAINKYNVEKTLSFFKSIGLLTVTDSEGRIYPMSNTAASVLDALRLEIERLGIVLICGTSVESVKTEKDGIFTIDCIQAEEEKEKPEKPKRKKVQYAAKKLVIATGGKASPVHGSDGSGFTLLNQLGHRITPLVPALVQLTTDAAYPKQLKGIRVNAGIEVTVNNKTESRSFGEILFTEYGLSGIAAMEVSRAAARYFAEGINGGCRAILDLAPGMKKEELAAFLSGLAENNSALPLDKFLIGILPGRVGQVVCKASGLYDFTAKAGSLNQQQLDRLVGTIKAFCLVITGTRGFSQAQVTAGGADVSGFNPQTLESRQVENLYCCGEVLDVDGGCGGFNLQWAWSSGLLAGECAAAHSVKK